METESGFHEPFGGKNPPYKCCVTCEHFGSVFSYRLLKTGMMCGFGEKNCKDSFGKPFPSGYIMRRTKSMR